MSRARVHPRSIRAGNRVLLVTGGIAALLPLGACLAAPAARGPAPAALDRAIASGDAQEEGSAAEERSAAAAEEGEDEGYGAEAAAESDSPAVHGFLAARSRSRWTEDADDHDVYAVAGVDAASSGADPWRFHVLGRGSWDVDGERGEQPFPDIEDTYGSSLNGRLYEAHADIPAGERLDLLRAGRQIIHETPTTAYFDGARVETAPAGPTAAVLGVYGGLPVHLYESSSTGDVIAGAYARLRPWMRGQLRLDWMHLEDETRLGEHQNDLFALGLRHRFGRNLRLEGEYSRLEDEDRDVAVRGLWFLPEEQFSIRASHYRLLEPQTDLVNEINPFYNALAAREPYDQSQIQVSKGFGERLEVAGGFDTRRVDDENDIGRFNRDFDRFYVTAILLETLPADTILSLTGEVWDSEGQDIETWGIDLENELDETLRASLGSYYSLYKYYLDSDSERENVRTYYAEVRKKVTAATALSARYEYEDEELDEYHTLRVGMTWRF
ncbi:MAG: hypothetical protein AB1726_01520 [Planctomycetota bacterium]